MPTWPRLHGLPATGTLSMFSRYASSVGVSLEVARWFGLLLSMAIACRTLMCRGVCLFSAERALKAGTGRDRLSSARRRTAASDLGLRKRIAFLLQAFLLAIYDEDKQHERLVRYYKGAGNP